MARALAVAIAVALCSCCPAQYDAQLHADVGW